MKPSPEPSQQQIDFSNTEIAFSNKSDKELKEMSRLFKMMNKPFITNVGSKLGLLALKLRLPLVVPILKGTIFKQFCGGESLLDCQNAIDRLYKFDTLTVLDYGAEGKTTNDEFDTVMDENMRAVELAASNNSVPVVVSKITGLAAHHLLEKMQKGETLTDGEQSDYNKLIERIDSICQRASDLGVAVFIDAEESWIQDVIDDVTMQMMAKHNIGKVVVYNTYQMYRHDRLERLKNDHAQATRDNFWLGAKLVRGAYMEKERARAEEMGYPSPIQPDKASTDRDFDTALEYCIRNYETIASCCATHNLKSSQLQADLIEELGIDKTHSHLNFCQLYGMSDNITFNLADAGYNVAKYVPYGPIRDVVPYLIRRAQENTSVTGEMSRELSLIDSEKKRRGL